MDEPDMLCDERSREEPRRRDAAAPKARVETRVHPNAVSGGDADPPRRDELEPFIVGRRADPVHTRLVRHLAGSSAAWAPRASLLVANLCRRFVEDTDWDYSEFALYDLGQAVAHMTVQAQALGLFARQFRAFDRAGLVVEFGVPTHWEVTTMTASGRAGAGPERDPSRLRRPMNDIEWPVAP